MTALWPSRAPDEPGSAHREERTRSRWRGPAAAASAACVASFAGMTGAIAGFTTSADGEATATLGSADVDVAALPPEGPVALSPGSSVTVGFSLAYEGDGAIRVSELSPVVSTAAVGCPPDSVRRTESAAVDLVLPTGVSHVHEVTLTMRDDAPDGCQGIGYDVQLNVDGRVE